MKVKDWTVYEAGINNNQKSLNFAETSRKIDSHLKTTLKIGATWNDAYTHVQVCGSNDSAAMLVTNRFAGVGPQVNLRNPLHAGYLPKGCVVRGVSAWGCLPEEVSTQGVSGRHPPWTEWQTGVKKEIRLNCSRGSNYKPKVVELPRNVWKDRWPVENHTVFGAAWSETPTQCRSMVCKLISEDLWVTWHHFNQGWEAQPHTHLNANFKSINIC